MTIGTIIETDAVQDPEGSMQGSPGTPPVRALRRVARVASKALVVVIVALACISLALSFMASMDIAIPGGYQPLVVRGGSMAPSLSTGSILVVHPVDPADLAIGDVITFHTPLSEGENAPDDDTYTTHRITGVYRIDDEYVFSTQGDANDAPDSWEVRGGSVIGRAVVAIPLLGYVSLYAKTPIGYVALILLPGLAVIGLEVRSLLGQARAGRVSGEAGGEIS